MVTFTDHYTKTRLAVKNKGCGETGCYMNKDTEVLNTNVKSKQTKTNKAMEAGARWKPCYSTARWLAAPTADTKPRNPNTSSSFRRPRPRRPRWWGTPGPRCGGAGARVEGRSWWRRAGGRWERGSAPREWGCCRGSAWGWWPAACGLFPPLACVSVEQRWRRDVWVRRRRRRDHESRV